MANPQKDKGDAFEWALIKVAKEVVAETALTVERTRAGYQRDYGDILIKLPDDQILATVQAKNRREHKWGMWLEDTLRQAINVRARFSALIVKRNGIRDVGRSLAIMPADQWFRLLATLAERERELAEQHQRHIVAMADLRRLTADPDVLADEPGTVRGAVVYPRSG